MTGISRRTLFGAAGLAIGMAPALAKGSHLHSQALLAYFKDNGPKLLRPAQGLFKQPSIAPSLPGKQYSAELWDWDTLWTARGLFRLAGLTGDREFLDAVTAHAKGSLATFLDFQTD